MEKILEVFNRIFNIEVQYGKHGTMFWQVEYNPLLLTDSQLKERLDNILKFNGVVGYEAYTDDRAMLARLGCYTAARCPYNTWYLVQTTALPHTDKDGDQYEKSSNERHQGWCWRAQYYPRLGTR